MSGYSYLASPYTDPDPLVREARFRAVCHAAAKLMSVGHVIFSPIAHSHPIEVASGEVKPGAFWAKQDIPLLRHADKLLVLQLEGWKQSQGVNHEMILAKAIGIPVVMIDPFQL